MEESTYYRMNEWEEGLLKKISDATLTNYQAHGQFIQITTLWSIIEDLYNYYDSTLEKLQDLDREINENYVRKEIDYSDYL